MILDRADHGGGSGAGDHWNQAPAGKQVLKGRHSLVSAEDRERRFGQRGATVLLTGLHGSGKSAIAYALEKRLFDDGRAVTVLYGQNMRQGLCRDLGFSADDRSENLRRSAEVAKIISDAGMIAVCAFVAPHEAVREKAKDVVGRDRFVEIYCNAPIEVCRQRDKTGMYAKADRGEIAQFPGVSAAFEEPRSPDLVLQTDTMSVDESVERIVKLLRDRGIVR
jgi:bifunctional enzyme CysN/CysC